MQYENFIERIKWGEEFLFQYEKEKYWISQNHNGYYLTSVSNGYSQNFNTIDDLIQKAEINGKKIIQLWDDIHDSIR